MMIVRKKIDDNKTTITLKTLFIILNSYRNEIIKLYAKSCVAVGICIEFSYSIILTNISLV